MNKKIINQLLVNGKTITSEKNWLKGIKFFYKSFVKNPKKLLNRAIINITPLLNVKQLKQKRKRSQSKEFPYVVNNKNRVAIALRFFLNKTKSKHEIKIYKKLIIELVPIANNTGIHISKKKVYTSMLLLKKNIFTIDGFRTLVIYNTFNRI